jgi:hypothetical protein
MCVNTQTQKSKATLKTILNCLYLNFFFMCDIPCILVYDCNNFTNTCTIHLFTSVRNKEVNCACVGEIITIMLIFKFNTVYTVQVCLLLRVSAITFGHLEGEPVVFTDTSLSYITLMAASLT